MRRLILRSYHGVVCFFLVIGMLPDVSLLHRLKNFFIIDRVLTFNENFVGVLLVPNLTDFKNVLKV